MKCLVLLTVLALCAFGWVDLDGRDSSIPPSPSPYANDAISLTCVNNFQVPSAYHILGLAHETSLSSLALRSSVDNSLMAVDYSGIVQWTMDGPGVSGFGACHTWPPTYGYFTNSWTSSSMFYCDEGSGWSWSSAWTNPAGTNGRGMEYSINTNYFWQTNSSTGLYWMDETGANTYFSITEPGSQMSGITLFPYNGNMGIIVTVYDYQDWFFYEFEAGVGLTYLGSASPGLSYFETSLGITYSPDTGTFFWSYEPYDDDFWIGEFSAGGLALEQNTWGGIKSEF